MIPTLADGDLLLVARTPPASPHVGDLVIVDLPGRGRAVKRLQSFQDGGYWVERDNPREGVDSWHVGAVPQSGFGGVVVTRLWPRPRRFRRLWDHGGAP